MGSTASKPPAISPALRELLLGVFVLVGIVAAHRFSISYPLELSADESELLVQIERYDHDIVPWRSVDGSTIGPANPWFLMLVRAIGWPMTYGGIHLLAAVMQAMIVVVSYATVRQFLPFRTACLVAVAGAVAVGASASINFMYYATELVPATALAAAVLALVRSQRTPASSAAWLAFAALVAGIAPWAKLQATPIAAVICSLVLWFAAREATDRRRIGVMALVVFAALTPTLALVALVSWGGALADLWASYFVANLGYAGGSSSSTIWTRTGQLLSLSQLSGLMAALGALGLYCLATSKSVKTTALRTDRSLPVIIGLYLFIAIYCCVQPPHGFGHYHIFLIGPLLVALGLLVRFALPLSDDSEVPAWQRGLRWAAVACVLLPILSVGIQRYRAAAPLREHLEQRLANRDQEIPIAVTRALKSLAPNASSLAVWGWLPALHVESGLRSSTRQTTSHFLIDAGPSREFLRRQFMNDLQATPPDVVVDAVASDCFTWFWPVESSGIESFPEFAAYVSDHFTLALSVVGDQSGVPLRVFVRKPPAKTAAINAD